MAGARTERLGELPSLVENDGYFISCGLCALLVELYDPGAAHSSDPLCWPYFATEDDLTGLPPHVISVNEVDPLPDIYAATVNDLHRFAATR
jgi:hypothetical protein